MKGRPLKRLETLLTLFWKNGKYDLMTLWGLGAPVFYIFTRFFIFFDVLVYPKIRQTEVAQPIFIMGHPRSGTSFFQKQVYKSGKVASFTTFDILFPSVLQRKILRPFAVLLRQLGINILQGADRGHEISLEGVEEDEALFLHRLDSEIITFICPWILTDDKYMEMGFKLGWNDSVGNKSSLRFYRACLKRHIFYTQKTQIVAKCNPSVFRIKQLLKIFPDAKFVYMVRSPQQSIQSFLSFSHRFIDPLLTPEEQKHFFQRKYKWCVQLYRYFEQVKEHIPPEQLLILPFTEVRDNLKISLERFFTFAGTKPPKAYWQTFGLGHNGRHKKIHSNAPLERFGLTRHQITDDLGFVWKQYLLLLTKQAKAK